MLYVSTFAAVMLAGIYLITLGLVSLAAPTLSKRFLLGFAGSPAKHYIELAVRLVVGVSLLVQSPFLIFPGVFRIFAWVILGTTLLMLFVPWRWHQRFANKVVPAAIGYLPLIGLASVAIGAGAAACLAYSVAR